MEKEGRVGEELLGKKIMPELLTRKQIRLKNYNYSGNGYYFITVCSIDRKNIFGEYENNVGAVLASARYQNACARNNIKLSKIGENNQ